MQGSTVYFNVVFIVSFFRLDVCDSPEGTYKMCPLCDESLGCHFVDLKTSCMLGKVCCYLLNLYVQFFDIYFI